MIRLFGRLFFIIASWKLPAPADAQPPVIVFVVRNGSHEKDS